MGRNLRMGGLAVLLLILGACEHVAAPRAASEEKVAVNLEAPPPPPPPPPPPTNAAGLVSEVTVTGSRTDRSEYAAAAPMIVSKSEPRLEGLTGGKSPVAVGTGGRRQPEPQAGMLTAGDHDDLLNARLYGRYVSDFLQANPQRRSPELKLPYVDTARRITVAVQDPHGRPVPFATVAVRQRGGGTLSLRTVADGTVVLFPGLDNLTDNLEGTVSYAGETQTLRERQGEDVGEQRVLVRMAQEARAPKAFDLLLVVDTTGSMGDELEYLKTEMSGVVARLARANPGVDIRVGAIFYRDVGDEYVVRPFPFTGEMGAVKAAIGAQRADGGGDEPEAMEQALAKAMTYDWREGAVKAILLVADAPPHDPKIGAAWNAVNEARARRIHIVPVGASGVNDTAQFLMRSMAVVTQSRYLFLTDDSGIGNPHTPPVVDCYLVTRLDGLITRTLAGLIAGHRIEPDKAEVIRTVGDYDRGVCRKPVRD